MATGPLSVILLTSELPPPPQLKPFRCINQLVTSFQERSDLQTDSPLFKLSPELRNKIFDYVLLGEPIPLTHNDLDGMLYGKFEDMQPVYNLSSWTGSLSQNTVIHDLHVDGNVDLQPSDLAINTFSSGIYPSESDQSLGTADKAHPLALLSTCRKIYCETWLSAMQLCTLTYKLEGVFCPKPTCHNDRLLWMYKWQRETLRNVHIYAMYPCSNAERFIAGLSTPINTLSQDLKSLTSLHISMWSWFCQIVDHSFVVFPEKFDVELGLFHLSELPLCFPTLRELVVEFVVELEHLAWLDIMVLSLAERDYNKLEGHTLVVDIRSVYDLDWMTKYNGKFAPDGMASRGLRWSVKTPEKFTSA